MLSGRAEILAVVLAAALTSLSAHARVRPVNLRCNGLQRAVGVPRDTLELSWQFQGEGDQSAYRVVLSSEAERAAAAEGDVLDTDWVRSPETKALVRVPGGLRVVWWSVSLRDGSGASGPFASPQRIVFAPDEREWTAAWIVDPAVALPDSCVPNSHSFFRQEFRLDGPVESAFCFVTADDYYKLYINGQYVGQGPAPAYLDSYWFNAYDVTPYLRSGEDNCVAVHGYYQGLVNRVWVSGDNRSGLILQLEVRHRDGRRTVIGTDGKWRVLRCNAYSGEPTGYRTQFLENVDGRRIPDGWRFPGFDDSAWPRAKVLGRPPLADRRLVPQPTPVLEVHRVEPRSIRELGPGHYLIDFGRELVGTLGFRVKGPAGHAVEIRHGEELESPTSVRYRLRANCTYREMYTLAGRRDETLEFYDYKGFRYVELLDFPSRVDTTTVWATERHYPWSPGGSGFRTSDSLLQRIWDLCVRSIRAGSQEVYVDCPTREKGQYLGDSYIEGISHLYATAELLLQKKALADFARSADVVPTLLCVAPCSYRQEIADYSLEWPLFLEEYYWLSGDRRFLRRMFPVLERLLNAFRQYENEDGLLEAVPMNNLVDWPPNLRDDYDLERAKSGVNTVLNALYIGALGAGSRIARELGRTDRAAQWQRAAMERTLVFNGILFKYERGLYVDAAGSDHASLHANVLPLYFGICPPDAVSSIVRLIARKRFSCGVYFAAFVLRALYRAGHPELAYDLLTSRDRNSWANMLRCGATTTLEAWDPDLKWNTSWCHAWATSPIFIVAEELMGLKPAVPGWRKIRVAPQFPRKLQWAELHLRLPVGEVQVAFESVGDRRIEFRLVVPAGAEVEFRSPRRLYNVLSVDGAPVTTAKGLTLGPGNHRLVARWSEGVGRTE